MKLKFQLVFNPSDDENNASGDFDPTKDVVFICGALESLGEWNLTKAVEMTIMKRTDVGINPNGVISGHGLSHLEATPDTYSSYSSLSSVSSLDYASDVSLLDGGARGNIFEFQTTIDLDQTEMARLVELQGVQYKYFVAQKSTSRPGPPLFLKQIEYNWRQVDLDKLSSKDSVEINDKWPLIDIENRRTRIDSGWLIDHHEHEIQFHFFNSPLELWSRDASAADFVLKIVPFKASSMGLGELKDYLLLTNDYDENQTVHSRRTRFNSLNEPNFYSSHRVRFRDVPTDLLFQIHIHEIDEYGNVNEKQPVAIGFYKVNRYLVQNSLVDVDISLMSANQIVGSLKAEILLITGPKNFENTFIKKNFNYHFNKSCIPIGHRGMGKTFDAGSLPGTSFVENTIDSFREAYNRGAQMVEFDVVLTKDKIPIVYHDFVFCIDQLCADKQNNSSLIDSANNSNKLLSLAVNQLTYNEVKQSRIYSHKILKKSNVVSDELKEYFTSKFMFPTLKEMCTQLDPKLGFNVEIKYPIDLEDGSHEVEDQLIKWLNRNEYVDCILKELYESCKDDNRCVILSTFDPNLCTMLRLKQSKFPVLFLTNGVTDKWVPYKDVRCKKTRMSLNFARSENLHGIVAHAEELTKNLHLINILFNHTSKSANFLAYSWGDDLNELDKRRMLTESGLNGIIYDRINESK